MRAISMKHFDDKKLQAQCVMEDKAIPVGQVVGEVYGAEERDGANFNGEVSKSIVLLGEFEGLSYSKPDVKLEANTLYMPTYFAREVMAALGRNGGNPIAFAVEIQVEPSGRAIPFQRTVVNLVRRSATSRLELLKAELQLNGKLRLSPPSPEAVALIKQQAGTIGPLLEHDDKHGRAVSPEESGEVDVPEGDAPDAINTKTGEVTRAATDGAPTPAGTATTAPAATGPAGGAHAKPGDKGGKRAA